MLKSTYTKRYIVYLSLTGGAVGFGFSFGFSFGFGIAIILFVIGQGVVRMSGVPLGMIIAAVLIVFPLYKIVRANYVALKLKVIWFVVAIMGVPIGTFMSYMQIQRVESAATDAERLSAMMAMSLLPNFMAIFWALVVFLIFRSVYSKNRKSMQDSAAKR